MLSVDLSKIPFLPFPVLEFSSLDTPFNIDLTTLRQILAARLGLLAPDHNVVPLRAFLAAIVPVHPGIGRGHGKACHGLPALCVAYLRVSTQISDNNRFIHRSHGVLLLVLSLSKGLVGTVPTPSFEVNLIDQRDCCSCPARLYSFLSA